MIETNRRDLLRAAAGMGSAAVLAGTANAAPFAVDLKVTLLGTKGEPRISKSRANSSNLIMADGKPYVVDCGYGVTRQLAEAGIECTRVSHVLITNPLADHMLELGPLLYNAWITGRNEPIQVYGPPPLRRIMRTFFQSLAQDIDIRVDVEGRSDLTQLVKFREFDRSGTVFQEGPLKVSAVKVRHPPVLNSFAYRFDTPSRSIVISGATSYSPELIAFARGADVLVHEVMHIGAIDRALAKLKNGARIRKRLLGGHTASTEVGRVAAEAEVKTLVLSHFIPGDDPALTEEMWAADVKKSSFTGRVIVGRDLMTI